MNHKFFLITNLFMIVGLLLASQVVTASAADHTLTRISKGWDGSQADGGSGGSVISEDGRYVLFDSYASNLIKGGLPKEPYLHSKLYLYDQETGKTELVSVASDGSPANNDSGGGTISSDGRYVAFWSNATNNIAGYPGYVAQVYLRDRKIGKNYLVSAPLDGSIPDGDANCPYLSASGRYVAFESF